MFERITEKTFDEIFPLLESAFPVTELRVKEDQRALLKEPCYRLYGVRKARLRQPLRHGKSRIFYILSILR